MSPSEHTDTSDEHSVLLVFLKTTTFSFKDEAKHFHLPICRPPCGGRGEDTKIFAINDTLMRGIATAKLAQTARKSHFFFCYVMRMLAVSRFAEAPDGRPAAEAVRYVGRFFSDSADFDYFCWQKKANP